MSRYHKSLGVLLVAIFGLWGCARGPVSSGHGGDDKAKMLENRLTKLQDEFKLMHEQKEQLVFKLAESEDAAKKMQDEIQKLNAQLKDRELVIKNCTKERDTLQIQYDGFVKEIKDAIGKAEAARPIRPSINGVASSVVPTGPKLPGTGGL